MNANKKKTISADFDQLVGRLKTEDANYATICRGIQVVYWVLVPVYIVFTIRHYINSEDINQLIGGASMVLAFVIFALFFGEFYKEYKYVDYSVSTVVMLKKAANRYKPFHGRIIWVVIALVLMDIGLVYIRKDEGLILEGQLVFIGGLIFGLMVGLILWYFKYKPLRDSALRLIAEIEGD